MYGVEYGLSIESTSPLSQLSLLTDRTCQDGEQITHVTTMPAKLLFNEIVVMSSDQLRSLQSEEMANTFNCVSLGS
jgi:hypothetical protein